MKLFTILSFLKYVSPMELLQLALILKRHHVLVNQLRIFLLLWGRELAAAQFRLLELTISEYVQKLFDLETEFISKFSLYTVQEDWLLKTKIIWNNMKRNSVWINSRKLKCWRVLKIYILHIWNVLRVITNFFVKSLDFFIFVKVLFLILKIYIITFELIRRWRKWGKRSWKWKFSWNTWFKYKFLR